MLVSNCVGGGGGGGLGGGGDWGGGGGRYGVMLGGGLGVWYVWYFISSVFAKFGVKYASTHFLILLTWPLAPSSNWPSSPPSTWPSSPHLTPHPPPGSHPSTWPSSLHLALIPIFLLLCPPSHTLPLPYPQAPPLPPATIPHPVPIHPPTPEPPSAPRGGWAPIIAPLAPSLNVLEN